MSATDSKTEDQKSNGYEFDCEPRVITEAARAQWATGVPDWFKSIGRKKEGQDKKPAAE